MKIRLRDVQSHLKTWWFVYAYALIFFSLASAVVLHRWWQFENYYFDHGIFDQVLWSVAQGNVPLIDHNKPQLINQLGDHFTPSHYLLTPLYWFTTAYEPLLLIGLFCLVASGVVFYFLSYHLTKHKLLSFSFLVAFTWYIGIQNTIIAGYHTELPALLTLALSLWAFEKKQWGWFWLLLLLTFGFKETFTTIGAGIAVYAAFQKKFTLAAAIFAASLLYFVLVTQLIIPQINGEKYGYKRDIPSAQETVKRLFSPEIKVETQLVSFATFGLMPLASVATLPLIYQDFYTRFVLSDGAPAWNLGMHYSTMVAAILFFASAQGARVLLKYPRYRKVANYHAIAIMLLVLSIHYQYSGPLGLAFNPTFYGHTKTMSFLYDFVEAIPEKGVIMTQNNLAPKLLHSDRTVMLLRENYREFMPDVIAVDTRDGQSPNNSWPTEIDKLVAELEIDPDYRAEHVSEEQILFLKQEVAGAE